LRGKGGGKFWKVRDIEIFRGQGSPHILEVGEVGKFGSLGRSGYLRGREVWKDFKGGKIGRNLSPIMNVFLQLHVDCVRYHSGD
jgi:hypothetical protein